MANILGPEGTCLVSLRYVITKVDSLQCAQNILGWAGKIRVDGLTYNWMGGDVGPPNSGNVTNVQITPTRSIFTMQAGPMNVTVTYLSPIEVRTLSLPERAPVTHLCVAIGLGPAVSSVLLRICGSNFSGRSKPQCADILRH